MVLAPNYRHCTVGGNVAELCLGSRSPANEQRWEGHESAGCAEATAAVGWYQGADHVPSLPRQVSETAAGSFVEIFNWNVIFKLVLIAGLRTWSSCVATVPARCAGTGCPSVPSAGRLSRDGSFSTRWSAGQDTCQMCGDRMSKRPICRKAVERRILLY